jgi:hypothetical protein
VRAARNLSSQPWPFGETRRAQPHTPCGPGAGPPQAPHGAVSTPRSLDFRRGYVGVECKLDSKTHGSSFRTLSEMQSPLSETPKTTGHL